MENYAIMIDVENLTSICWGCLMGYVCPTYMGVSESGEDPQDEGEPVDLGGCPMFIKNDLGHGNYMH